MENWEEGWDRLLEEANRQLQKETKRIQDAWKGIYAGMNSYAKSQLNANPDSQANRKPDEDSHQPDFTSHVYGEQPIRRAGTESPKEASRGAGWGKFGENQSNHTYDKSQKNNPRGNYAVNGLDRKAPDRRATDPKAPGGKAPDRRSSGKKLPEQLQQLLDKIQRDSSTPFVDYRLQRNPIYQLNFYDESYHFYEQAALMADYEDNCPYSGEFGQIFWPTYQKLDLAQLRGYFTWRTTVRRVYEAESQGIKKSRVITEAPLCYQYLYVYEILNQVGVDSVWDGYQRLKYIEANLEGQKNGILPHLRDWLFDYVIYYQLDRNLLSDTKRVINDRALSVLLAVEEHTPEEVFDAASVLSTYQVGNSRYVREHLEQYQEMLYRVLVQMGSYYEKNRKVGFWESLFGVPVDHIHQMFEGAIFYDRHINLQDRRQEVHYELDELCSFDYARGRWNCDGYYRVEKNATLGQIMCAVDAELRTQYQYEYPIRNTLELKYLKEIVVREVHRHIKEEEKKKKEEEQAAKAEERRKKQEELRQKRLEEERLREEEEKRRQEEERKKREVVLDFGKLDEIRRAAEITQQRLLVEEPADAEVESVYQSTMTQQFMDSKNPETAVKTEGTEKTAVTENNEDIKKVEATGITEKTESTEIIENIEKDQAADIIISKEKTGSIENADADKYEEISVNGVTLSEAEVYILRALLDGQDYKAYFQSHHLMPSLVAESLNEKLLDEIGDIVIEFDGDEAVLVEDYVDEIKAILS